MVFGGLGTRSGLGLIEHAPCLDWVKFPWRVSMGTGQYLLALAYVRPAQEVYLPALISASQVDFTGKPVAVCK